MKFSFWPCKPDIVPLVEAVPNFARENSINGYFCLSHSSSTHFGAVPVLHTGNVLHADPMLGTDNALCDDQVLFLPGDWLMWTHLPSLTPSPLQDCQGALFLESIGYNFCSEVAGIRYFLVRVWQLFTMLSNLPSLTSPLFSAAVDTRNDAYTEYEFCILVRIQRSTFIFGTYSVLPFRMLRGIFVA